MADPLPNRYGVLADAAGEHDGIESAQRARQRTQLPADAVNEQIHREFRSRFVGSKQGAHVAGNAGDAEQARLLIEQLFDGTGIHLQLVHQIEDDPRVQVAAAGAHRQSVHGGEAHGAGHALAVVDRAHAGAVAQMQHHGASRRRAGVNLRQDGGDVFIGQAVEAVAPHAPLRDFGRQGEHLGHLRLAAMESGVETGHLQQLRLIGQQQPNRLEVVGLV